MWDSVKLSWQVVYVDENGVTDETGPQDSPAREDSAPARSATSSFLPRFSSHRYVCVCVISCGLLVVFRYAYTNVHNIAASCVLSGNLTTCVYIYIYIYTHIHTYIHTIAFQDESQCCGAKSSCYSR